MSANPYRDQLPEIIEQHSVFEGRKFSMREDRIRLADGSETRREFLDHPGSAAILAMPTESTVLLIRTYRHPVREVLYEIPAGTLDVPGESPEDCARRELEEETGYKAERFELLTTIAPSPGTSSERIWIFRATNMEQVAPPTSDEALAIEEMPIEKALDLMQAERLADGKTVCAVALQATRHQ